MLCGGLGTRLGDLTHDTPKPLIAVSGRPFLAHVLDQLITAPIDEIVLAVSFQWQKIQTKIGTRWRDVKVSYSIETEPLGTGGAIRQAMKQSSITEALVANGDTFLKINPHDLIQFATDHAADIAIALRAIEDSSRFGKVSIDLTGRIVAFQEKAPGSSGLINSGLYYLKSSVLDLVEASSFSFEKDILTAHHDKLAIFGMQTTAYFIDMGIPDDLARARIELPIVSDDCNA